VVWSSDEFGKGRANDEYEIHGQLLDAWGSEIGENDARLSSMGPLNNAAYDAYNPALAYCGTKDEFLVVWQGDDARDTYDAHLIEDEYEIFAQRYGMFNSVWLPSVMRGA
jgi:hypothetical protein